MDILESIKKATWQEYKSTLVWLALNIFAGIIPICGSYFFLHNLGINPILREPLRHGELAILSISILAGAIYVIARGQRLSGLPKQHRRNENGLSQIFYFLRRLSFPGSLELLLIILVLVVFSTLQFAGAITSSYMAITDNSIIDEGIWSTIGLLGISLFVAFFVTLIDNTPPPDVRDLMGGEFDRWERKIEQEMRK